MEVLTEGVLLKALKALDIPEDSPCAVLHPCVWKDYKKTFKLSEEQMKGWFIKSSRIK